MNAPGPQQIRVLVVEDSRSQQELLVAMLHSSGEFIVVGTAGDGKQVVDAVQRLRPQVIAMDIHHPRLCSSARQLVEYDRPTSSADRSPERTTRAWAGLSGA